MDLHLSIKFIPNRKFTNWNITLTGRKKKLKITEQWDEILKQYGISGCTDFSFPLKSEHPVSVKPPTHPNPNVVRICKSVRNIGRSLILIAKSIVTQCKHWCHIICHSWHIKLKALTPVIHRVRCLGTVQMELSTVHDWFMKEISVWCHQIWLLD